MSVFADAETCVVWHYDNVSSEHQSKRGCELI